MDKYLINYDITPMIEHIWIAGSIRLRNGEVENVVADIKITD